MKMRSIFKSLNLKYFNLITALCTLALSAGAESFVTPISFGTQPYIVEQAEGVNRVFVFENISDASLTAPAMADWYAYPDLSTPVGTGMTAIYPENGMTYLVRIGNQQDTVAVFDYSLYRIAGKKLSAFLTCETSTLSVDVNPMTYYSLTGQPYTLARFLSVQYTDVQPDSVSWVEKEMEDTFRIQIPRTIDLGHKLLAPTQFDVLGDQFAEHFYGSTDLVRLEKDSVHAVAIDFIPRSYTLLRGNERENEVERVIDESVLTGSAPLNILFRANASPLTTIFSWEIQRSEQILSSRTDTETRFQFDQTGKYTVKLHIANDYGCECDTSFQVDAKESMLAVPNVFTPNGDGIHDEFRVAYRSIRTFSMVIFDRWQHQVYSSSDPARGWNGTINGRPAAESAYTYIIEAVGTDGTKYKKKGTVNLLRGKK